ncbi:hypothetical protein BJ875DRAFT_101683 [Amylocarpus encephaloides]|uniref:Uncharacterized protein n=1 Tax=Amylocarpus encephaloides TaxID=45428 RepID=A0A9P7YQN7_9HELO|nr:hypothetical protein BJ875DRAFT_101683 [Amylocarpus encephaloides]
MRATLCCRHPKLTMALLILSTASPADPPSASASQTISIQSTFMTITGSAPISSTSTSGGASSDPHDPATSSVGTTVTENSGGSTSSFSSQALPAYTPAPYDYSPYPAAPTAKVHSGKHGLSPEDELKLEEMIEAFIEQLEEEEDDSNK